VTALRTDDLSFLSVDEVLVRLTPREEVGIYTAASAGKFKTSMSADIVVSMMVG
jgi:hypothetical protein